VGTANNESGQFLNAIPSSNLGLRLEDQELMIAVALRTGCKITTKHRCLNCTDMILEDGLHGLSCQKGGEGRAARHKGLNIWLSKTLQSVDIGNRLEPNDLWPGKRPDGVTILPFNKGKRLIWDVTVSDSFAPTYRQKALSEPGLVAEAAEIRKIANYRGLEEKFLIQPVAFETLGAFGPSTRSFLSLIGKALINRTGDKRAASFMKQRISVELQRFNSWCIKEALVRLDDDEYKELDYLDIIGEDED
jgi:hypothetical protein